MLDLLFYILVALLSVAFMEIVAILAHKYIMHGPGWFLHKSHHTKHNDTLELNDIYFIFFSMPSVVCIVYGFIQSSYIILSVGIGILMYGMIYLIFHDIIVHNRFGLNIPIKINYIKKVKKSHMRHHKCKNKHGATNFGFITYR